MIEKIYCKDCFFFTLTKGTLKDDVSLDRSKGIHLDDYEDGDGQCHRYPPVLKPNEDYLHHQFHNEVANNFVFVSFEDWCGEGKRETKKKNFKQLISETPPEILKDFDLKILPLKDKVKGELDPKVLKVELKDLKLGWGICMNIKYRKRKYIIKTEKIDCKSVENRWVDTIEEILEFSESEILKWKGFGPKKLQMIKTALNQEGIFFVDG